MGRLRIVVPSMGPAIAGPRTDGVKSTQVMINVSGELEDGRAFFGTDAVREIDSP